MASGPTMPDASKCEDAYRTAEELGIVPSLPASIRRFFEGRILAETPKPGGLEFAKSQWVCLLDNAAALESLEGEVRSLGWVLERDLSVDDQPVEFAAETLLGPPAVPVACPPGEDRRSDDRRGAQQPGHRRRKGRSQPSIRAVGCPQAGRAEDEGLPF